MSGTGHKKNLGFSFLAAFRGIFLIFSQERNARIHLIMAMLVTTTGLLLELSTIKWMIILLLFALVISIEMINTSIEKLADIAEPGFSNKVRDLKDISAGAVLWTSLMAAVIGIIIFAPEILAFIRMNLN